MAHNNKMPTMTIFVHVSTLVNVTHAQNSKSHVEQEIAILLFRFFLHSQFYSGASPSIPFPPSAIFALDNARINSATALLLSISFFNELGAATW